MGTWNHILSTYLRKSSIHNVPSNRHEKNCTFILNIGKIIDRVYKNSQIFSITGRTHQEDAGERYRKAI